MVHRASAPAALALLLLVGLSTAARAQSPKPGLPLEPDRYATFTTSKGTWISLDVSPDGQTIVFDLLGDLYTLPIAGGTATRLLGGLAFDAPPRWGPGGEKGGFLSDPGGGGKRWAERAE